MNVNATPYLTPQQVRAIAEKAIATLRNKAALGDATCGIVKAVLYSQTLRDACDTGTGFEPYHYQISKSVNVIRHEIAALLDLFRHEVSCDHDGKAPEERRYTFKVPLNAFAERVVTENDEPYPEAEVFDYPAGELRAAAIKAATRMDEMERENTDLKRSLADALKREQDLRDALAGLMRLGVQTPDGNSAVIVVSREQASELAELVASGTVPF